MKNALFSLALAGLAVMPTASAQAQETDYEQVFDALFSHMALTYMCREDLGGLAHYQAARSIAIGTATPLVGADEAVIGVDKMDQRFRSDPRAANPSNPPGACVEMVSESLHRINVEKAKAGLLD